MSGFTPCLSYPAQIFPQHLKSWRLFPGTRADSLSRCLSCLLPKLHRSLPGEQNHFQLGPQIHRSNRISVVEWYGLKPLHDPSHLKLAEASTSGCQPRTSVRGSGPSGPRKRSHPKPRASALVAPVFSSLRKRTGLCIGPRLWSGRKFRSEENGLLAPASLARSRISPP
jgi:hypothetical protein